MLSTEHLNLLWLSLCQNPDRALRLREELHSIATSPEYHAWWKEGVSRPFAPAVSSLSALTEAGLVSEGVLQVKINSIGDRLFVTDGAWVDHAMRVFPDPDEALALIDYAKKRAFDTWADWVIDPAAGCGHTPMGIGGGAQRVSCDANVRALTYAAINARLNGLSSENFIPLFNNMMFSLPSVLKPQGNVLFVANVPFAPVPREGLLAINSGGGLTGGDLQIASIRMIKKFHDEFPNPVRACLLTWTVGSLEKDTWEVPEKCKELMPEAKIRWELLHHDYDAPELPNPSPLKEMFLHLATSQYAIEPEARSVREKEYLELAGKLSEVGHSHIAYGMLEIDLA